MEELDLRSRLAALRRLAKRYRRLLISGAAATALTLGIAAPALANDETPTPLAACSSPLATPCSATVTAAAALPGDYTVALPGGGTLTITIGADSKVTGATVTGLTGFTASVPKVDADKDKVTVVLSSTTDPTQVFNVKVSVKHTAGGLPVVTAKVKAAEKEGDEAGEHEGDHEHSDKGGGGSGDKDHD